MAAKSVLVIDDDGAFLRSVRGMIGLDFDVFVASDGYDGIEIAKRELPDLILLDYQMEDLNGKETFLSIRMYPELAHIPIVFLTGESDQATVQSILGLKPQGYLLKPVTKEDLLDRLKKII